LDYQIEAWERDQRRKKIDLGVPMSTSVVEVGTVSLGMTGGLRGRPPRPWCARPGGGAEGRRLESTGSLSRVDVVPELEAEDGALGTSAGGKERLGTEWMRGGGGAAI
jgi:hypothetical protein